MISNSPLRPIRRKIEVEQLHLNGWSHCTMLCTVRYQNWWVCVSLRRKRDWWLSECCGYNIQALGFCDTYRYVRYRNEAVLHARTAVTYIETNR